MGSKTQVPNCIFVVGQETVFWLQLELQPVWANICTLELIVMLSLSTKEGRGNDEFGDTGTGEPCWFCFVCLFLPA